MSEDDIKDLIGEFVVDGYRFKVVTSHVVVKNPDQLDIVRAGGIFPTDFFITVPYQTYATIVEKGFVDVLLDMIKTVVPGYLASLED